MPLNYIRDPEQIFQQSIRAIEEILPLTNFPQSLRPVARRIVHACALPEIADNLKWHGDPVAAVRDALKNGAEFLTDCEMLKHGITALPPPRAPRCFLNHPDAAARGRDRRITRSAAAVELWQPCLGGAVVAISGAPTALFRLLEGLIDENWNRPAVIFAFPVGFVGAAESKSALSSLAPAPYLTLAGRLGGSPMAAAAVNAAIKASLADA